MCVLELYACYKYILSQITVIGVCFLIKLKTADRGTENICMLGFFCLNQSSFFKNSITVKLSVRQTVWFEIRPDVLLCLLSVQTVCNFEIDDGRSHWQVKTCNIL